MENLYNKASLVMTPQMVETGKVYSMKPEDRKGDFTFSRATYATRVNEQGKIEKETQNLLTYSNDFSSWSSVQAFKTDGQSGYDGSNDAWLLTDTATSADHRVFQYVPHSGVYTLSVYAKAGTKSIVYVQSYINNSSITYFDLSAGSVLSTYNDIDSKIEDVGNGWYRCSITFNNTNSYVTIGMAESATRSYVGDGTGTIYIQDAQLEQGLVARDYIETTTAAVYGGITDNVPRLDYTDSSCPALLLEPQRTNLFDYSEYASGNSSANTPTLVENYAISPEGYQNAFQISTDAGTFRRVRKILTGLSGNTLYSMSIFVKKATSAISTYGGLGMVWQGGTQKVNYIIFDEYNGTMSILQDQTGNTSTKVDDVGDYWRFSVSATDTGSNTSFEAAYYACLSATGSTIGVGIKTWVGYGFQLEEGSYATSYIPTYGSAVTRNLDVNTLLNQSGVIGQTEGTIFFDAFFKENDRINFSLSDSTSSNYISIETTGLNSVYARIQQGGSTQANIFTSNSFFTDGQRLKCAVAYKANDFAFYINGTQIGTDTSGSVPVCDDIRFARYNGAAGAYQSINQVLLFKTRISNEELAELTAL